MDILVHVPKVEEEHFWDTTFDVHEYAVEWWTLPVKPRRLEEGDYIWFKVGKMVVARAKVLTITDPGEELVCEMTGRNWKGAHVIFNGSEFEQLSKPFEYQGRLTRGFTYLDGADNWDEWVCATI
jgi:hypothetical protein